MLRVLGQHAAHQIADDRRQPLIARQRGVGPKFQLAAQDRRIVELRQRRAAERQAKQQHAKRIDIVGDAAVAAAGRQAHR